MPRQRRLARAARAALRRPDDPADTGPTGRNPSSVASPREALLGRSICFGRSMQRNGRSSRPRCAAARLAAGQTVVRQGDTGDFLYVLGEGILDVEVGS